MAFVPKYPNYAGILPIQEAAKGIIERDFEEALAWRCSLDGSTPGANYKRIQLSQRHSKEYPLLVIQTESSDPVPLTGGIQQQHFFDCEIFVTKAVSTGNLADAVDELAKEITRYYDATFMAWESASQDDWQGNFPAGANASKLQVFCSDIVWSELERAKEEAGLYSRSAAFQLVVKLIEAEGEV